MVRWLGDDSRFKVLMNTHMAGWKWVNIEENRLCQPTKLLFVRGRLFWTRVCLFHNARGNIGCKYLHVVALRCNMFEIIEHLLFRCTTMIRKCVESSHSILSCYKTESRNHTNVCSKCLVIKIRFLQAKILYMFICVLRYVKQTPNSRCLRYICSRAPNILVSKLRRTLCRTTLFVTRWISARNSEYVALVLLGRRAYALTTFLPLLDHGRCPWTSYRNLPGSANFQACQPRVICLNIGYHISKIAGGLTHWS